MRRIFGCLGIIAAAFSLVVIGIFAIIALIFHTSYPPQPKFGYRGDWRVYSELGMEERKLPAATNVWKDYEAWKPRDENGMRLYVGYLGGAGRQSIFRSWHSKGDTPMGAQKYTSVEFLYQDPVSGPYRISWMMRGEHNVDFLKFDNTYRLYQLIPFGNTNDFPPQLSIHGIEGVRPEFQFSRIPTNTYILSPGEIEGIKSAQPLTLFGVEQSK